MIESGLTTSYPGRVVGWVLGTGTLGTASGTYNTVLGALPTSIMEATAIVTKVDSALRASSVGG